MVDIGRAEMRAPRGDVFAFLCNGNPPQWAHVDQATRDRGWTWSDLGDCRALLGELERATQAYTAFIARAETKSPKRALEVLRDIHASLERTGDPGAARLGEAIATLQDQLEPSTR